MGGRVWASRGCRHPQFAWLQQHCQGHHGYSWHTHTISPNLRPTITTLSTPARSWLAHNCTPGCVRLCVCMCVCSLKAMPCVFSTNLSCQLLLSVTGRSDTRTWCCGFWSGGDRHAFLSSFKATCHLLTIYSNLNCFYLQSYENRLIIQRFLFYLKWSRSSVKPASPRVYRKQFLPF